MPEPGLRLKLFVDGGSRGNPGPAAAGFVALDADDGQVVREAGLYLGRATNNVAEYRGLLAALAFAAEMKADEVDVVSDSQLLVRQMTGEYRVKNEGLKPLHAQAGALAAKFRRCGFHHVPREQNTHADGLVNQALNLKRDVHEA